MSQPQSQTIISSLASEGLPDKKSTRGLLLGLEALFYTGVGLFVSRLIGIEQWGVFSIFLTGAALRRRLVHLLDENRTLIWDRGEPGIRANALMAFSLVCIFAGVFLGYLVFTAMQGRGEVLRAFGFALQAAGLGSDDIFSRTFPGLLPLLVHNGLVLLTVVSLTLIYSSYGALLALIWNASIWALVLGELVRRGVTGEAGSTVKVITLSVVAVGPHLLLEAAAYILGAMTAIFLSKGLLAYELKDPRFARVARACLALILMAVSLVIVAGMAEAWLAPAVLALGWG